MKMTPQYLLSLLAFAAFAAPTISSAADMTAEQIAEIMETANEAEIDAAQVARRKAEHPEVKDFAKMMIDQHKTNKKEGKKVAKDQKIKAKNNDVAEALEENSKEKLKMVKNNKGADFDRAYMDMQIEMHQQLLTDLDSKFIPAVQNAEYKSFLEKTKAHVQEHLTKAQSIRSKLQ